ncbi:MAG: CDP-alcohol phosphatidyltransferase family protein [Candidatus Binataceae bacterium]
MVKLSTQPAPQPPQSKGLSLGHLLNIPNILTLLRLFSIPIFLALLSQHRYTDGLYLFCLAALTDALDGTVARWFDAKTELGAFLDPFADKLMLVSAFVVLTITGSLPGWLLGVALIRDTVIVFGYFMLSFLTSERVPVRPSYLGKATTCLQIACVIGALAGASVHWPLNWQILLYVTVGVTALSGLHYAYRGLAWLSSREPEMFE